MLLVVTCFKLKSNDMVGNGDYDELTSRMNYMMMNVMLF